MTKLIIFGAGKIADVVHAHFSRDGKAQVVAFVVDAAFLTSDTKQGLPVVSLDEATRRFPPGQHDAFVAMGYQDLNRVRAARCDDLRRLGYKLISYVSPLAGVAGARIGENVFVGDCAVIQPGVQIGSGTLVWGGAVVGHHSTVGDHNWITSGSTIGGSVVLGERCFLGLNCTLGHEISVGAGSVIGAGARVTKSAAAGSVFIEKDTDLFRLDSERFLKLTKMR